MKRMREVGPMRCSPTGIVSSISGTLSFNLVACFKIMGNSCGFSSACASSGHALGYAFDDIASGRQNRMFVAAGEVDAELRKQRLWWMTIVAIFGVIFLAAAGIMPIVKSAMLGVVLLLALGIITPQESYQSINWQVIVLISALIPVGTVIQKTGTAEWIGGLIAAVAQSVPEEAQVKVLIGLIYLITVILTEVSSNAATAIIMTPIALAVTNQMGLDPRAFVFAVAFAASASFITPVGYQTNLMVYGPGGYKFSDYIRVGFPLALIFWIVAIFVLPVLWPTN